MQPGLLEPQSRRALERAWEAYLDRLEPLRPDLHRYCRRLTGGLWDCEDLVQDTLLRAFGALGRRDAQRDFAAEPGDVRSPRAFLFRTATNLWIDRLRHASRQAPMPEDVTATTPAPDARLRTGEAAARLLSRASPQERVALVLKDVFGFTLEEIADTLTTTVGAVKSALHRARGSLDGATIEPRATPPGAISPKVVDRFVAAFNARDVAALTGLLLENVAIEVPPSGGERGRAANWISYTFSGHDGARTDWHWAERRELDGEAICVHLHKAGDDEVLEDITRLESADGLVTRIRSYCFCPQTLEAAAAALQLQFVTHGHRFGAA
jgi:RNA polymerase sigma-70 factor (ECF subfamily)